MVNYGLYSWVVRGKQRASIIKAMDKTRTPSQIRKKASRLNPKLSLNYTSDTLREFKKQGVAVCWNEKAKTGRLYKLTKEGEKIRAELMREEGEEEK